MRVVHVIKGLGPGGAERLLVWLAQARSDDVDVDVAYLLPSKSHLVDELRSAGAPCHLLGGRWGLWDPRWPVRLARLVRRSRADVVHIHSPAVAAVARPILQLRRSRPRLVVTEHNVWPSFDRATRIANALTTPLDDATLAVSDEVRASAWPRLRPRIEVVLQGVPVGDVAPRRSERPQARERLGITDQEVLVVTVANFREKKDYPTLLRAAQIASDAEPRLRFVAIGQGPLERQLANLHAELGLGDRFRFLGYVADPVGVVAGADIFALASRHEGMSIAMLEAIALGVPVVATSVGGIPQVITPKVEGLLVAPGDPQAVADALLQLARNPDQRAAYGMNARRRAREFDIASAQRTLESVYERLLGGRSQ